MDPTNQNKNLTDEQKLQPAQPVGSVSKEVEKAPVSDYVEVSDKEPKLHPEVAETGVEVVSERPPLTVEHKDLGIKESIPEPATEPTGSVQFPMTKQQADNVTKNDKKVTNSIFWLAISVIRQFLKKRKVN